VQHRATFACDKVSLSPSWCGRARQKVTGLQPAVLSRGVSVAALALGGCEVSLFFLFDTGLSVGVNHTHIFYSFERRSAMLMSSVFIAKFEHVFVVGSV